MDLPSKFGVPSSLGSGKDKINLLIYLFIRYHQEIPRIYFWKLYWFTPAHYRNWQVYPLRIQNFELSIV